MRAQGWDEPLPGTEIRKPVEVSEGMLTVRPDQRVTKSERRGQS